MTEKTYPDDQLGKWISKIQEDADNEESIVAEVFEELEKKLGSIETLSLEDRRFDLNRIIFIHCSPYFQRSTSLNYITECLPLTRKLKPLCYRALSLVDARCSYPELLTDAILEDLRDGMMHALIWCTLTLGDLTPDIVTAIADILKNFVFRSVVDIALQQKACVALVHFSKRFGDSISYDDVTPRFEVLLSHPNVSSALRTALFQLMSLITKQFPYSTTRMAMLAAKTYESVVNQMIAVNTDKDVMNQLSLQCRQCLAIIEAVNFSLLRGEITSSDIPSWLKLFITTSTKLLTCPLPIEDTHDATMLKYRLLCIFYGCQLSLCASVCRAIYQQYVTSPTENLHGSNPMRVTGEDRIILGNLFTSVAEKILSLINHKDQHIKYTATQCMKTLSQVMEGYVHCSATTTTTSSGDAFDAVSMHITAFSCHLQDTIRSALPRLLEYITKDKILDLGILRTTLDILLRCCDNSLANRLHQVLLKKAHEDPSLAAQNSVATDAIDVELEYFHKRRREYLRTLILLAHRSHVQQLAVIEACAESDYKDIKEIHTLNSLLTAKYGCEDDLTEEDLAAESDGEITEFDEEIPIGSVDETLEKLWKHHASTSEVVAEPPQDTSTAPAPQAVTKQESIGDIDKSQHSYDSADKSEATTPRTPRTSVRAQFGKLANLVSTRRLSGNGSASPKPNITPDVMPLPVFRSEYVTIGVLEDITARCSANGLLLSCDVRGIISVSSRLNEAVPCELGLNISHHDVFPNISQRLRHSEWVTAKDVSTEKAVKKVDSRGSIFFNVQPGIQDNIKLLEYSMNNDEAQTTTTCPLKLYSSVVYSTSTTAVVDIRFINSSKHLEASTITATIPMPPHKTHISFTASSVKKNKISASYDTARGVVVAKIKRIRPGKECALHVVFEASGMDRVGKRNSGMESTVNFNLLPIHSPMHFSDITGTTVRFVKIDKTKISKNIEFDVTVRSYTAGIEEVVPSMRVDDEQAAVTEHFAADDHADYESDGSDVEHREADFYDPRASNKEVRYDAVYGLNPESSSDVNDIPAPSGVPPPPKPPQAEQPAARASETDSVMDEGRDTSIPHQGADIVSEQYNF